MEELMGARIQNHFEVLCSKDPAPKVLCQLFGDDIMKSCQSIPQYTWQHYWSRFVSKQGAPDILTLSTSVRVLKTSF